MLIGFLKYPPGCDVRIIKFVDRIWLKEDSSAEILRRFVLEVDSNSPDHLESITCLVPGSKMSELQDRSYMGADRAYYFNMIFTSGPITVKSEVKDQTPGLVDMDGIEDVLTFRKAAPRDLSSQPLAVYQSVRYTFPRRIKKGERVQVILYFRSKDLINDITPVGIGGKIYAIDIPYFKTAGLAYDEYMKTVGSDPPCVKICKYYGKNETGGYKGGFDIFLYLPPNFTYQDINPPGFEMQPDQYLSDGSEGTDTYSKLIWRMRKLFPEQPPDFLPHTLDFSSIRGLLKYERPGAIADTYDLLLKTAQEVNQMASETSPRLTEVVQNLVDMSTQLRVMVRTITSQARIGRAALLVTSVGVIIAILLFILQQIGR